MKTTKAAATDRFLKVFPDNLLRHDVDDIAKTVPDICNCSISLNNLPSTFKLSKLKANFKSLTDFSRKKTTYFSNSIAFEGH